MCSRFEIIMMRTSLFHIIILAFLYLLMALKSHAVVFYGNNLRIDFTNEHDAVSKVIWSASNIIKIANNGLGWESNPLLNNGVKIQTKPVIMGLSWRPSVSLTIQASVHLLPSATSPEKGAAYSVDTDGMYFRYSPDLKHWSSWQKLNDGKPHPRDLDLSPSKNFSGTFQVPSEERIEFETLISKYQNSDIQIQNEEETLAEWIAQNQPDFFEEHLSFMGFVELKFEGELFTGQSVHSITIWFSWGVGGFGFSNNPTNTSYNIKKSQHYRAIGMENVEVLDIDSQ